MTLLHVASDLVEIKLSTELTESLASAIDAAEPILCAESGISFEGSGLERLLSARDYVQAQLCASRKLEEKNTTRVAIEPLMAQMIVHAFDAYAPKATPMKPASLALFNSLRDDLRTWVETAPGPDNSPLNFAVNRPKAFLILHCISASSPELVSSFDRASLFEMKALTGKIKGVMAAPTNDVGQSTSREIVMRIDIETAGVLLRSISEGVEALRRDPMTEREEDLLQQISELGEDLRLRLESLDSPSP